MSSSWPGVLGALAARRHLEPAQARWAMDAILAGDASNAQIAGFVLGLRVKGETPEEVAALAAAMAERGRRVDLAGGPVLDVVGTGGDQHHSVNVSTMAALVCAAAGATVVKHGNRAVSSSTGTADVLEALGVAIDLDPEQVVECVEESGIGFCFAPVFHPAMRHAAPARRELVIPTVFNILGPLTNPAGAQSALVGCAAEPWAPIMADVLARRSVRALVVRGDDGADEISTTAPTTVWDARGSNVVIERIDSRDLGCEPAVLDDLRGGDSHRNAELLRKSLGACDDGDPDDRQVRAIRSAVAVNAAAALVAYDCARGVESARPDAMPLTEAIAARLPVVENVIARGAAVELLDRWAAASTRIKQSASD